jgi:hypothetical protein
MALSSSPRSFILAEGARSVKTWFGRLFLRDTRGEKAESPQVPETQLRLESLWSWTREWQHAVPETTKRKDHRRCNPQKSTGFLRMIAGGLGENVAPMSNAGQHPLPLSGIKATHAWRRRLAMHSMRGECKTA